jgi:hypothetical protein
MASGDREREPKWSESVAVGRRAFVEEEKRELASRVRSRWIAEDDGASVLRDVDGEYGGHFGIEMGRRNAKPKARSEPGYWRGARRPCGSDQCK